jgi:hypothetical protein
VPQTPPPPATPRRQYRAYRLRASLERVKGAGAGDEISAPSKSKRLVAFTLMRLLRARGLPIKSYVDYTVETDENHLLGRPGQYVSKANFRDGRLDLPPSAFDVEGGGSIETFNNESDARRRYEYVAGFG